jgi:hypothetical protein
MEAEKSEAIKFQNQPPFLLFRKKGVNLLNFGSALQIVIGFTIS